MEVGSIIAALLTPLTKVFEACVRSRKPEYNKNENSIVINISPSKVDLLPTYIEPLKKEKNKSDELKESNMKEDEPYQPMSDEFYEEFLCDIEMNKRRGDVFNFREE